MYGRREYVSAQRITHDGSAQAVTIPAAENNAGLVAILTSEAGDTRYAVNGDASATSTWLPEDDTIEIGPLFNLTSLSTFGAGGAFTCVVWYATKD